MTGVAANRALPLILQGLFALPHLFISILECLWSDPSAKEPREIFSLEFGVMQTIHDGFCSFFRLVV